MRLSQISRIATAASAALLLVHAHAAWETLDATTPDGIQFEVDHSRTVKGDRPGEIKVWIRSSGGEKLTHMNVSKRLVRHLVNCRERTVGVMQHIDRDEVGNVISSSMEDRNPPMRGAAPDSIGDVIVDKTCSFEKLSDEFGEWIRMRPK